jgi:hypothetical protein
VGVAGRSERRHDVVAADAPEGGAGEQVAGVVIKPGADLDLAPVGEAPVGKVGLPDLVWRGGLEADPGAARALAIWSVPDTRKALLAGLADKGFGADALSEMQRVIDAENSDIFDVLAYVAFALDPLTRVKRAADAKGEIRVRYTDRQQAFLDFVLDHYTKEGVGELDGDKLAPLLKLRYKNAISDALADLGDPDQIRGLFIGFQRYLYEARATSATT